MFFGPKIEVPFSSAIISNVAITTQKITKLLLNDSRCGIVVYQHLHRRNHQKCSWQFVFWQY